MSMLTGCLCRNAFERSHCAWRAGGYCKQTLDRLPTGAEITQAQDERRAKDLGLPPARHDKGYRK